MVKEVQIYLCKLKKDLFGCFRIEEEQEHDNETSLKEGGVIQMSNYSAFHIRDARSLSLLNTHLVFIGDAGTRLPALGNNSYVVY